MRRLLLLAALTAAVLVPIASAAPSASGTLRGTVVAKDRAHHALVVARPGGTVQMVIAPRAFSRTAVGRSVAVRYSAAAGRLPVALAVTLKGHARKALVRGTIVRLVKQRAVLNAGGSLLRVTLRQSTPARTTASARSGPSVGDEIEVEVELEHGALTTATVVAGTSAAGEHAAGGEMEVRGAVSALTPATATAPGSITVTVNGLPITCSIPAGVTLAVKVGDLVELECVLVGNPAVWTVHVAKGEDEDEQGDDDHSGPGHDGATEVEARGTIAAPFLSTSTSITVMPSSGAPVTCAITAGSLPGFSAGDHVKVECKTVGGILTLKEIEKTDSAGEDHSGPGGGGDDDGDHHGGGDDGGGHDD